MLARIEYPHSLWWPREEELGGPKKSAVDHQTEKTGTPIGVWPRRGHRTSDKFVMLWLPLSVGRLGTMSSGNRVPRGNGDRGFLLLET